MKSSEDNTKMHEFNLFKVSYQWCEGDHKEVLLGKSISKEDFERDLIEARDFAEKLIGMEIKEGSYLGKGYRVECLPEYYEQIIWFLTEKRGYVECYNDENIEYFTEDDGSSKIYIRKRVQKTEWQTIGKNKEQIRH